MKNETHGTENDFPQHGEKNRNGNQWFCSSLVTRGPWKTFFVFTYPDAVAGLP